MCMHVCGGEGGGVSISVRACMCVEGRGEE